MSSLSGGVLPALVTPIQADGSVNTAALEKLLAGVFAAGVDGVYVCGSTGEGLLLSAEARKTVVEVAVKCAPAKKQVIAHIGTETLETTLDLARHASKEGVTAVSSLPPPRMAVRELPDFYAAIARNSDVPVVAYYFPGRMERELTLEELSTITGIPGVSAVKFTDYDLYKLSLLAAQGVTIFNGRDEVFAAGLLMGAAGGIGSIYNLIPGSFVRLFAAATSGRWESARKLQRRINQLIAVLLEYPLIAAIKEALRSEGIECGSALSTPHTLSDKQTEQLNRQLDSFRDLLAA